MFVCCDCFVLSGRGLCDELITRPEESYRLWCVVVCDLETSWMRSPWPTGGGEGGRRAQKENLNYLRSKITFPRVETKAPVFVLSNTYIQRMFLILPGQRLGKTNLQFYRKRICFVENSHSRGTDWFSNKWLLRYSAHTHTITVIILFDEGKHVPSDDYVPAGNVVCSTNY